LALAIAGMAVAVATGCGKEIVFECLDDSQCVAAGGIDGVCQAGGYCSYEDDDCPSEQRYGPYAAPDLAGYCVPSPPGAASGGTPSSSSAAGSSGNGDGSTSMAGAACQPTELELDTILAACRSDSGHDPVQCTEMAGPELIMIDQAASQLAGAKVTSYVAFVAPEVLQGVHSATLRMWTYDDENGSDAAGEVWRTAPFTGATLRDASPDLIDVEPIGHDPGNAPPGTMLSYVLDVSAFEGESTFHFAIVPMSDDGLRFFAEGVPGKLPRLVVNYCPEP
jgi:hypothetical protein